MSDIKERVITAIRDLPDNATYEDIFDVIYVQEKISKALKDSQQGRFITQEQFEEKYNLRGANRTTEGK